VEVKYFQQICGEIYISKGEKFMANYGEALRRQRLVMGKTLLDVEKATGISNQNLSRWERGEVLPNIDFCVKLAKYYGITLEELIDVELP